MNKSIKTIFLFLVIFLSYNSSVLACAPGFSEFIYDASQILDDYYPLMNGVGDTNPKTNPILNQNFEVIAPLWGPEYMLPVYLASKNKQFSDEIKLTWAKYLNSSYRYSVSMIFDEDLDTKTVVDNWVEIRKKYSNLDAKQVDLIARDYSATTECPRIRFQKATERLNDLGARFNQKQLAQWINYQDQEFKKCTISNIDFPAIEIKLHNPTTWQTFTLFIKKVLKIDIQDKFLPKEMENENEYQLAASEYHEENYDKAIELFDKIYKNKDHPRRDEAALSLGWSYIAKANQQYELDLKLESKEAEKNHLINLKIAQRYYEKITADISLSDIKQEANKYLDYVLYRTDPITRLSRAGKVLSNTSDPREFMRNIYDYNPLWYKYFYDHIANQEESPNYDQYVDKLKESGDEFSQLLLAWNDPKSSSSDQSINKYKETSSPLWLILAQRQINPEDGQWSFVDSEIKKISPSSPFFLTAQYYNLKSKSLNKKLNDSDVKSIQNFILQTQENNQYSAQNLFNNLMFNMVDSLIEKQKYSQMNYLNSYGTYYDSTSWSPYYRYDNHIPKNKILFISKEMKEILSQSSIDELNKLLSEENIFTPKIKQYLRLVLFTKATLENRLDISKNMAVLLAKNNSEIAKDMSAFIRAHEIEEQKFLAVKFILDYPEITSFSGQTFDEFALYNVATIKEIDRFRRNWLLEDKCPAPHYPGYYKKSKEINKLSPNSDDIAINKISRTIIDFANENPAQQLVPESLHRVVNLVHYGSCTNKKSGEYAKKAFQLLHTNYSNSYWAKQTPYWYE